MAEPALKELISLEPDVVVHWRAFELRPEPVTLLDPRGDYLTRVWRDHVYPLAQKMNMPLKLPPMQPRSRMAHEAAKWADNQKCFDEYNLALFRAFFEYGLDIGKKDVLVQLAVDLKLDPDSLAGALKNEKFANEVHADQEKAGRIGVHAVPAFAVNDILVASGVQTAARLQELLRRHSRL